MNTGEYLQRNEDELNTSSAWSEIMENPVALKIDLSSPEYTAKFEDAPIYQKAGKITALQITAEGLKDNQYADKDVRFDDNLREYVLDTYVMRENNGERTQVLEDTRVVRVGDWLATNPIQQEGDKENNYTISNETFQKRYTATDESNIFQPKGLAKIISNETGRPVEIDSPWGGMQNGDEACYFCAQCDADGQLVGKRYILSENDFANYEQVDK